MTPLVSVVIPAYNAAMYLKGCVDSIIEQTMGDWEIIIVDDGSSDSTGMICREYTVSDSRIRHISQSNQGVSIARNNGIKEAKGQYVMFVDADDLLPKRSLETFYQACLKYPDADIVRGEYVAIDSFGNKLFTSNKKVFNKSKVYNIEVNLFINKYINHEFFLWLMWIKKSRIDDVWFTDGRSYMEDAEFLFKAFRNVNSCIYIPNVIYYYRKYEGSASSEINDKKLKDIVSCVLTISKLRFDQSKLTIKTIDESVNYCWQIIFNNLAKLNEIERNDVIERLKLRFYASKSIIGSTFVDIDLQDFIEKSTKKFIDNFLLRRNKKNKLIFLPKFVSKLKEKF